MSTPEQAPPNTGRPFLRRGPSGPLADTTGLIQCGYDQPTKSQPLAPSSGFVTPIPRDATPLPLQVQLPNVVPGNSLEIDCSGAVQNIGEGGEPIAFIAVVSFDGNTVFAPASSFFGVNNSQSGGSAQNGELVEFRCFAAVVIPDGATIATVQILYDDEANGAYAIFGTDTALSPGTPSITLKVSEISAASVSQPGPSNLIPS